MTLHNILTYGGAISKSAAMAVGLGRDEEGLSRLDESLQIGLNLWDEQLPEFAYHRNEKIWGNGPSDFQAAVAAEYSVVGIRNPANSGRIVVVERFSCVASQGVQVRVGPNTDYVPTVTGTCVSRDTRVVPINNIVTQATTYHGAVLTGAVVNAFGATLDPTWLDIYVVLTPGFYLHVSNATVNVALTANFMGRDRPALPGELPGT